MNEIGSEFWLIDSINDVAKNPVWEKWSGHIRTYLSGRTALSAILDDICLSSTPKQTTTAYLPSYCCHTMIEPFVRHGMKLEFYSVNFKNGEFKQVVDCSNECDVILVLDYFGYCRERQTLPNNATVIRDMTHAAFSTGEFFNDADYTFASFRKWGAIAGAAVALKRNGSWLTKEAVRQNTAFLSMRNTGYRDKAKYIAGETATGKGYLRTFQQAESLLVSDYENYSADVESLRSAECLGSFVTQRRKNARVLLTGLRTSSTVEPLFSTLCEADAPLFVPVVVKGKKRDMLRRYLIKKSIFCPIHWPLSDLHRIASDEQELYDTELSLVCDQRYSETDMDRQLSEIRKFESDNA